MNTNYKYQNRAIAYSLLAHIKDKGTFANGPLDIFTPLIKNALSELYPSGTIKGANTNEISNAIEHKFSLDIPIPVINNILKRIALDINKKSGKEDMRIFSDGSFWIEQYVFEDYSELIQNSKNDVERIILIFNKFCKLYNINSTNNESDLFRFIEQNRSDISYYLANGTTKESAHSVIAAQFVDAFKNEPEIFDKIRDIYLGSILTSYLEYQPTEIKMNVELLFDTNFIVSLLDLNTPESTKTCSTLIKVCKNLGYTFTVLKDTIEELQGLLTFKSENLNSAIIAKATNREDILNACDRRRLTSTDLDRLSDNIEDVLTQKYQFHIIPCTTQWQGKAKFCKEYTTLKKYRNTEKSALHDAIALVYVREKRGNKIIKDFNKVNCWFVNNAITHDNDYEEAVMDFTNKKDGQSEIIKVDDLLNILWLSNPSIGIAGDDIVNMGIASLISYTLSSSLPKARIIKELDDNIQKYRDDQNITDKDVISLSTRIVNRQINDVQELNELARKDQVAFATRIKEEAQKQNLIETHRIKKINELSNLFLEGIKEIKENKIKMDLKHNERMEQFENREVEYKNHEEVLKKDNDKLKQERDCLISKKTEIEKERDKNEEILRNKWNKENKDRKKKRELFIDNQINKAKKKSLICFIVGVFFLIVVAVTFVFYYIFANKEQIDSVNNFCGFNPISSIIGLITLFYNAFSIYMFYNWYFNPVYVVNKKELIKIPEKFENISWEDYISIK